MAISHETPPTTDIPEKPQKFPIEQLEATFSVTDIEEIAAYQEQLSPAKLLSEPLPQEFVANNRQTVSLLTYNVSRYNEDIERAIEADPVVARIKQQQGGDERVWALRTRRSIVALTQRNQK